MSKQLNPQVTWIVWMAMLISIGVYAVVAVVAVSPAPDGADPMLPLAIAVTSVGPGVMWLLAPRLFKSHPFLTLMILRWSFAESIAVFGFTTYFLGGPLALMAVLMAWGAVLIVLSAPTEDRRARWEGR